MWILIILMFGNPMTSQTLEFKTEAACETAKVQVLNMEPSRIKATCIAPYKK